MIWLAHPQKKSFCEGLADSYQAGAKSAGAEVKMMRLAEMKFDANRQVGSGSEQPTLEPDLITWQKAISWADHIMVIHPYWWAAMPGRAKAVFDLALTPDFAFKYHSGNKITWDKLLTGKTGEGIITSDAPSWVDTFLFGRLGRRVLKDRVLGFCGVKVKRVLQFGSVKTSTPEKRKKWLRKARKMGAKAAA